MSIGELAKKGKIIKDTRFVFSVILLIVLVILLVYGIERLRDIRSKNTPVQLKNTSISNVLSENRDMAGDTNVDQNTSLKGLYKVGGLLVASKTGSKYHLPWCSGAQGIKEENRIWFSSKEEAKIAGYAPATNCPALLER